MKHPSLEPEFKMPTVIIRCRECGTLVYPRKSPAGPMALVCECAREQFERALAGMAIARVERVQ